MKQSVQVALLLSSFAAVAAQGRSIGDPECRDFRVTDSQRVETIFTWQMDFTTLGQITAATYVGSGKAVAVRGLTGTPACPDLDECSANDSDSFSQGSVSFLNDFYSKTILAAAESGEFCVAPVLTDAIMEIEAGASSFASGIDITNAVRYSTIEGGHEDAGYSDFPLYGWSKASLSGCSTFNYYFSAPTPGPNAVTLVLNVFNAGAQSVRMAATHFAGTCSPLPASSPPVIGFRYFERVRLTNYHSGGSSSYNYQGAISLSAGFLTNAQGLFNGVFTPMTPTVTDVYCTTNPLFDAGDYRSRTVAGSLDDSYLVLNDTTRLEIQACTNKLLSVGATVPVGGETDFLRVGDANLNGIIRLADRNLVESLVALSISINSDPNGLYNVAADLDEDGTIDAADLALFDLTYCVADIDKSGAVNSSDFYAFLTLFFANDPEADYNEDGFVNSQDLYDFTGNQDPCS